LRGVAAVAELTETERGDVEAKLDALAYRLDQAELAVDKLDEAQDRDFAACEQDAREALKTFDAARADAWKAVAAAKRAAPKPST
jgi:hypothetical protein